MQPTKSMNKTFLHFLSLLFVTTNLSAQFDSGGPDETENITFQVKASRAEAAAGSSLEVSVTAKMDDGWHIYGFKEHEGSVATVIALDAEQPFKLGDVTSPQPKHVKKKFGETDLEYDSFEGEVTFTLPITISEDAPAGEATLKGSVKYQICSDKICLLP
ncbi:MAG: protein-disulfide reductase DsbD family protein, partial [Planctomycetota bacterium]|nr:protein-disulfide reductase DsbD family protein [Planctomycetota bacterium]